VSFNALASDYGVLDFQDALANFIATLNYPEALRGALVGYAYNTYISFSHVPVYHKIKFTKSGNFKQPKIVDVVHVQPEQEGLHGQIIPVCFDTVLVQGNKGPSFFNNLNILFTKCCLGCHIAQVHAVF
jgi:hypothetical protein